MKLKDAPWKKSYEKPRQHIKKQRHHFADKGLTSQSYGFSSSHVPMWELDHKKGWVWKNWCFWTVVLEKTLESLLDYREVKPVDLSPEYSLEGLMLKLQYFGHLMGRANSLEKTQMLGKTEGRRRRGGRGWDGQMASPTQWTWIWANSRWQGRTEEPGVPLKAGTTSRCQSHSCLLYSSSGSLSLPALDSPDSISLYVFLKHFLF